MWLKEWLIIFALIILTFYSYYFFQILRGRPEKFEDLLIEGMVLEEEGPVRFSVPQVGFLVALSLILEGGYFTLAWISLDIIYYRALTGVFIIFEIWHAIKMVPIIQGLAGRRDFSPELMNWKLERLSARFYVIHVLITLGLLLPF